MKSIFNSHNILLKALLALALSLVSFHAWGSHYYAELTVKLETSSSGMGKIYVDRDKEDKPTPEDNDYVDTQLVNTSPDESGKTYVFWMMAKPQGGYVFDSWIPDTSNNPDGFLEPISDEEKSIEITSPTSNGTTSVSYSAKFKVRDEPYNISYLSSKNGSVSFPSKVTYKVSDEDALSNASLVGYKFNYWKATTTTTETDFYSKKWNESVQYINTDTFKDKFGDVSLTAYWTPKYYKITFNLDDGLGDFPQVQFTIEDEIHIPTGKPTKTGRTFSKWKVSSIKSDSESESHWDTNDEFTAGDIIPAGKYGSPTLKAIYNTDEYTITFNISDTNEAGTYSQYPSIKYDIDGSTNNGRSATLAGPKVTKDGWDFDYWELDSYEQIGSWIPNQKYEDNETLENKYGTVTLKPHWKPKEYTITLKPVRGLFDGETEVVEQKTVKYNSNADTDSGLISNLPTVSRVGYTFDGWMVAASDSDGHNWGTTANQNASVKDKWGDVTLTAQWTLTTYQVKLNPNGGTLAGGETSETPYEYNIEGTTDDGKIDNLPKVEMAGYSFAGWEVTSPDKYGWSGHTPGAGDNEMSVKDKWGDVTLTAQWEAIPGYIKISVFGLQKNDSAVFEVSYDSVPFVVVSLDSSNASGLLVKIPDVGADGKSVTVTPKAWPKNYGGLSTDPVSKTVYTLNDNKKPVLYNFSLGERTSNIFETFREF